VWEKATRRRVTPSSTGPADDWQEIAEAVDSWFDGVLDTLPAKLA
jgi:hypothetical protein